MSTGIGEYHLKQKYLHLKQDVQELELVQGLSITELLQQLWQSDTKVRTLM
jgi:hypothetical protein